MRFTRFYFVVSKFPFFKKKTPLELLITIPFRYKIMCLPRWRICIVRKKIGQRCNFKLPISSCSGESSKMSESEPRKGEPGQFPKAPRSANDFTTNYQNMRLLIMDYKIIHAAAVIYHIPSHTQIKQKCFQESYPSSASPRSATSNFSAL